MRSFLTLFSFVMNSNDTYDKDQSMMKSRAVHLHNNRGGFCIFLTYPRRSEIGGGDDWTDKKQTVPV